MRVLRKYTQLACTGNISRSLHAPSVLFRAHLLGVALFDGIEGCRIQILARACWCVRASICLGKLVEVLLREQTNK
jgi:hypothetical protein